MKKIKFFMLAVVVMLFTACHDKIWDSIEDLDSRVTKLEELCKEMNTNISALQTIVSVIQENDFITGIVPIEKGGEVIGYTIMFGKHEPITIYNGKDGKDGQNGSATAPIIGVAKDTDGVYYWTLNGEWLLDADGNRLRVTGRDGKDGVDGEDGKDGQDGTNGTNGADGKDGITPQLKIENGYWYISYDKGSTWTELGKAVGEDGKDGQDGDSLFQSVFQDEDFVYFILADGTMIKIAKKNVNNSQEGIEVEIIDGAIIAAFSVSETKQVYFSKGNLQFNAVQGTHQCADGTTQQGTWRFANKQILFIGAPNLNASASYDGWIDLFCWGTSGWNSGAKEYLPYSNPKTGSGASLNKNYYVGNIVSANLTGDYSFADWGVYNAISNGGDLPQKWRTLSKNEWNYLLNQRTYANLLNINVVVAGISGMMLLPDNFYDYWDSVADIAINTTFNPAQWLRMEKVGAVFLPNAGYFQNNSYSKNENRYWSSTASSTASEWWTETTYGAYFHIFESNKDNYGRYLRGSVRLVQDVE